VFVIVLRVNRLPSKDGSIEQPLEVDEETKVFTPRPL
jgi:hypothetical protein